MAPKPKPEKQDELNGKTMEQLYLEEERLNEKHKEIKIKRNFVQQERVHFKYFNNKLNL